MKKWLSGAIAALMLLSSLSVVGCSNTGDDPSSDTSATTQTDTSAPPTDTTPESEAVTELQPTVEKQDYKGETFHMVASDQADLTGWYYTEEFISSGENVHVLNNAVYERNAMVEEHLGVEITYEFIPLLTGLDLYEAVQPSLMAGDDDYQLLINAPYYNVFSIVTSNYALDLYELKDIALDRSYWNRDVMEMLELNDHAYVGLGDLCRYELHVFYCNKAMLKDAKRQMPYDSVRNGTWTLDELAALTAGLYRDNGNGERDNEDTYGYAALWNYNGDAFMQASNIYVATRNEEGNMELSMYGERFSNLYEKIYNWIYEGAYFWCWENRDNSDIIIDFRDGHTYVTSEALGPQYLNASFEYGILPMPKYDTAQENYAHVNWGNNIIVPHTVQNKEIVGQVLEMMAYYSNTHLLDIYFNDILQLRASNVPDDREMVELIYDTIVFDPGIAYCHGSTGLFNLANCFIFGIRDGMTSLTSYYRKNERDAQKALDKLSLVGQE